MKHVWQRIAVCILLMATGISCHTYYKALNPDISNTSHRTSVIDSLKTSNRDFILRVGGRAFYMYNLIISDDKKSLSCSLDTLPVYHQLHLHFGRNRNMKYRKATDSDVLNEVHIYIPTDTTAALGRYTLNLDNVQKMEVLVKDKGRTTSSYIIGAIGYTIGALAVAAIIVAATKSSCPFVSAYDGNDFVLQGEIYGGAIYPQLARDDYMPLRLKPSANGDLQVKISNELQEKQYTDIADLLAITHDKNSSILSDAQGTCYEIKNPQTAVKAIFGNGTDVTASLEKANDDHLLYFDDTITANAQNFVTLQFQQPAGVKQAKLVLQLKNSYWLDYLYGELAKGFGKYYNRYIKKQHNKPASELVQWTKDQHMPLEVSVKTATGWKKVTDITTIGPVATRAIVVPLDLTDANEPVTEIKLNSGFMFWEMDYAAIDYSPDTPLNIETIAPGSATDETGKDVLALLSTADGNYLEQPVPGTVATITYHYTPTNDPGKTTSYILHTRGYYIHVRHFSNKPNVSFLKQFRQPNAFPGYSLALFKQFRAANLSAFAKTH